MAIEVTCSSCGNIASVPDSAAGGKRFCKMCGTQFLVPAGLKAAPAVAAPPGASHAVGSSAGGKVCRVCGVDLSQGKRIREADGTYWCVSCFEQKDAVKAAIPSPARAAPVRGRGATTATPPAASSLPGTLIPLADIKPDLVEASPRAKGRPPLNSSPLAPWPDQFDDLEAAEASNALYYPCRVCDFLFTQKEVYVEADGDTICKECWKTHEPRTSVPSPAGLPPGLEPAPSPFRETEDAVFCEQCQQIFTPDKLQLLEDGPVLCRKCTNRRKIKLREEARKAKRLAEAFGGAAPRVRGQSSMKSTILSIIAGLAGIGLLLWQLKASGLLFNETHHGPPVVKTHH